MSIFLLLPFKQILSQIPKSNIKAHFNEKSSKSIYEDSHLLILNDGKFINFGIYNNKEESDLYIWYSTGEYSADKNGNIELKQGKNCPDKNTIITEIKDQYKYRVDHSMIASDFEYVQEKITLKVLTKEGEGLEDKSRNIHYTPSIN